ncbi:unnamed protein product [Rotaria magnacalcarata]|uniref:Nuclear receptor domain-containing protein n=5 Tax=Rotaria magnacalcarata TaxID=392030 RepID=A0A814ISL6_9BILA|nr:unnamed protein product [Rotaria magnacalcarata]CAF1633148.1 unnamed protein product [Rotaria magnacalcarata]
MSITVNPQHDETQWPSRDCTICGANAIGVNFGVLTCSPCKAFFRRNAHRKDVLVSSCQHRDLDMLRTHDTDGYDPAEYTVQIRRCSSCRLRRCFDIGMKKELVRTEAENIRHKQLVDLNRQKREFVRQKQQDKNMSLSQSIENNRQLRESDWCHLSNIVAAYDTHCLKTYISQRSTVLADETALCQHQSMPLKHFTALPMSLSASLCAFFRALPAFHSLSKINQNYLWQNNLRSLLFPNIIEIGQSCFSEPWQISRDNATWALICGPQLYEQFAYTKQLAERSLIADPIITRLWMVVLFFSTSLFCLYDSYQFIKIPKKKTAIIDIQNIYATLLWKYLSNRHGYDGAVRIYSKLINVYLRMQRVGFEIGVQVRTRSELLVTYETLNQILTLDIRDRW